MFLRKAFGSYLLLSNIFLLAAGGVQAQVLLSARILNGEGLVEMRRQSPGQATITPVKYHVNDELYAGDLIKTRGQPLEANLATLACAQDASELQGIVADEKAARIVDASVALDDDHGHKYSTHTDEQGRYHFGAVWPGAYTLTIAARGFAVFTQGIDLSSKRTAEFDSVLKVLISEKLEVKAEQNDLSTITLSAKDLAALPRKPQQLMLRLRRLAGGTGTLGSGSISVDGFQGGRLPRKEMIQAISINSDSFASEFSEFDSGRIEITTKPATDSLHGELDFDFNDQSFNARNAFAPRRAPVQARNYSGALSGPVLHDRWGYFISFGRGKEDESEVVNATILNPATLQPQTFATSVTTPTAATDFSLRLGHVIRGRQTLDIRYSHTREELQNQGLGDGFDLPERAFNSSSRDDSVRLSLSSVLSKQSLNELRLELSRSRSSTRSLNSTPAVFVLNSFTAGGNQESLFSDDANNELQVADNFTYTFGNHTFKAGVRTEAEQLKNTDRSNFGGTFTFGSDFERNSRGVPILGPNGQPVVITPLEHYRRTLLKLPGYRASQFAINQGDTFVGFPQWEVGMFVQDDWRVSPRLTLSYGTRYEFQTQLDDKLNFAPRVGLAWRPFKRFESVVRAGAGIFYSFLDTGITADTVRFDGLRQQALIVQSPPFFETIPASFNRATSLTTTRTKSAGMNTPYSIVSTASYQQSLPWKLSGAVGYTWQRGVHLLRTRNINAPLPDAPNTRPLPDQGPILQFESTGVSNRHELTVSLQGEVNKRLSFYGSYTLAFARSDTDDPYSTPANSYDLSTEFGRADSDQRHQFYFEGHFSLPWGVQLSPNIAVASGAPFNITTGNDDNGDTLFTDRPAFANAGTAGAIITRFGIFNPTPHAGDAIIPRNFGQGPGEVSVNLNLSKTFNFGLTAETKAGEAVAAKEERVGSQSGPASAVGQKRVGHSLFQRAFSDRHYSLTFSLDVYNLINHTNFDDFNEVLTSPFFGKPNHASDARRINLALSLSF